MPDWKRVVRDAYREHGGTVHDRSRECVRYIFPDNAMFVLPNAVSERWAKGQLAALRKRYGATRAAHQVRRNGRPALDLEQVRVSDHARRRLALMGDQAGVDRLEFVRCLSLPQTVLWSDSHGSWLFVRDRLVVAVAAADFGHVVTTVMWATQDMFEAHPRPEKEGA